jgi:hypothetical protein
VRHGVHLERVTLVTLCGARPKPEPELAAPAMVTPPIADMVPTTRNARRAIEQVMFGTVI